MRSPKVDFPGTEMERTAVISDDDLYRYRLGRRWDGGPLMVFLMLNPSVADAEVDDPTIRRCMGFARREGCGGIEVLNLYALRCTKPVHLLDHPDPEGAGNVEAWQSVLANPTGPLVAAWGAFGLTTLPMSKALCAGRRMTYVQPGWWSLGLTKSGQPRHPLYVRADQPLEMW